MPDRMIANKKQPRKSPHPKKKPAKHAMQRAAPPKRAAKRVSAAKAVNDFMGSYRMQALWDKRPKKGPEKAHPGLYLAGVTAKMANDILAEHMAFMPAPIMTDVQVALLNRKKALSRRFAAGYAIRASD